MQRRPLWILAGIVVAGVLAAAGAIGFMGWQAARQNTQATSPATATSISPPTWTPGQSWTYNVTLARLAPEVVGWYGYSIQGLAKEVVQGTVTTPFGDAYNVSINGSFAIHGAYSGTPYGANATSTISLTGYAWYRTSDLASVQTVRTVQMTHSFAFGNSTWSTVYVATLRIDYDPPLGTWQFPLQANESWNVSSNATIHYASAYKFTGGNFTIGGSQYANVTIPIRFHMTTLDFANVTTPAGTFWSIHAVATVGPVLEPMPDQDLDPGVNATGDVLWEPLHPIASLWFSSQVGNVVQAEGWFGPVQYRAELVAYST
jgi:hypothetical protein